MVPGHRFVPMEDGFAQEPLARYVLHRSTPTGIGQRALSRQQRGQFLAQVLGVGQS